MQLNSLTTLPVGRWPHPICGCGLAFNARRAHATPRHARCGVGRWTLRCVCFSDSLSLCLHVRERVRACVRCFRVAILHISAHLFWLLPEHPIPRTLQGAKRRRRFLDDIKVRGRYRQTRANTAYRHHYLAGLNQGIVLTKKAEAGADAGF